MSKMRALNILVLGANGQDGSYAAEYFHRQGHFVTGIARQRNWKWLKSDERLSYVKLDLGDLARLHDILNHLNPDIIFNAAAVHGAAGFKYEENWQECVVINTQLTHLVLEYCRVKNPECRYLFLSSSKVFDLEFSNVVTPMSPRYSKCIYSTTKNGADDLLRYYRRVYNIKASLVYTFNHESPRRGPDYFIPKLVRSLVEAMSDTGNQTTLASLDFWCDWGHAREFMECSAELILNHPGTDICLATGSKVHAAALARSLFAKYGLDASKYHSLPSGQASYFSAEPKYSVELALPSDLEWAKPQTFAENICVEILEGSYGVYE